MNDRPQLFFAVPDGIDDPARVSGGNVYDARLRDGLRDAGWDVRMPAIPDAGGALERALEALPDQGLALVDGLLVARAPIAMRRHADRLRLAVLAHMPPPEDPAARDAFRAARRVIATSAWTRSELIVQGAGEPGRIDVARPGTDVAAAAVEPSADGGRLLCVGVVAPHKGQDVLVAALSACGDVPGWSCTIAGSLDVEPAFADDVQDAVADAGLTDRIRFAGVLPRADLDAEYRRADLLVAPSRAESFGMAITEALARGVPVVATGVGGIPEAIDGSEGAVTVPSGDPWALERVLRRWWESPGWRTHLAVGALLGRERMRTWADTASAVSAALAGLAAEPAAVRPGPVGSAARP